MARQTRAERRARRRQAIQGEPALAGAGGGGGGAKPPVAVAGEPPSARPERGRREGEQQQRRGPFASFRRFLVESWGELRKVEWPSQNQVIQGTVVVIIACAIMGTFIWVADLVFKYVVHNVLLR